MYHFQPFNFAVITEYDVAQKTGWVLRKFTMCAHRDLKDRIFLSGSRREMGSWDIHKAVPLSDMGPSLNRRDYHNYQLDLMLPANIKKFHFRFVTLDAKNEMDQVGALRVGNSFRQSADTYSEFRLSKFVEVA